MTLAPGERALIPTGLAIALPAGYELQVRPRSGLALRHGIVLPNSPGTIDEDYRGEIGVIVLNAGDQCLHRRRAACASPRRCSPRSRASPGTRSRRLDATARGAGGFGSTGLGTTGT